MRFSIIIPVYNVKNYLDKCIKSILNQAFDNYEIILVNDGSTDDSGKICDEYAKKDNRIRVIHKKNEGVSQARNDALKIANGEYIIFVDSDDCLLELSLESVNKCIDEYKNPDIIINRVVSYYEEDDEYIECKYKFDIENLKNKSSTEVLGILYDMPDFWSAPWVFVLKRKYIQDNNLYFIKGLLHEDEEWTPRVILNAKNIGFNNQVFYCNRANRPGSITTSINITKEFDKLKIIDRLKKESESFTYDEAKKKILLGRCSSLYLGILKNISSYKYIEKENYNQIVHELRKKKNTLLFSKRKAHIIAYIFVNILGINLTSKIISSRM